MRYSKGTNTRAGKEDAETTEDIIEAMDGLKKGDKVEFGVLRKGEHVTLTAESEGRQEHPWHGFRSFEFNSNRHPGFEPGRLKQEMEKLREELRSIGTRIRSGIHDLEVKLRTVTS